MNKKGKSEPTADRKRKELEGDAANSMSQNEQRGERRRRKKRAEREKHAGIGAGRRVDAIPQMPWLRSGL